MVMTSIKRGKNKHTSDTWMIIVLTIIILNNITTIAVMIIPRTASKPTNMTNILTLRVRIIINIVNTTKILMLTKKIKNKLMRLS